VGIGPSNLSLAALLTEAPITSLFLEKREGINWHANQLINRSKLQNAYLRDLVSLINPCSKFSYVNFLHAKGRLYEFLNADFDQVYRKEFEQYLRWCAEKLDNLHFAEEVVDISWEDELFHVTTNSGSAYLAQHVVLGSGRQPNIPDCAKINSPSIFHSCDYLKQKPKLVNKSVTIIGGGQTGAEVMFDLLTDPQCMPSEINWVSARSNFLPLDDSPFVNEYFSPDYINSFIKKDLAIRERIIKDQILASDGISMETLRQLYKALYYNIHLEQDGERRKVHLHPGRRLMDISAKGHDVFDLRLEHTITSESSKLSNVETVILCTGFRNNSLQYISKLEPHIVLNESREPIVNNDYSLQTRLGKNRIYIQNRARGSHGISDPNLSTMAWRSAVIINSILNFKFFEINNSKNFTDF
jgi:lysine N6-hydroxylase